MKNSAGSSPDTLIGSLFRSDGSGPQDALVSCATQLSYAQLEALVSVAASDLLRTGVQQGDRVVLRLANSPEYVVAFLAAVRIGAIAVPLDPEAGGDRQRFVVEDTEPRLLWERTRPDSSIELGVERRTLDLDRCMKRAAYSPDPRLKRLQLGAELPGLILYSSGSTGRPKGVVLTHAQLLAIARSIVQMASLGPDHRELVVGPLSHSGAWQRVTATLLARGSVVFSTAPLSIPSLLEDIQDHQIRAFFCAPPVLRALLRAQPQRVQKALASCRSIETASAPLDANELRSLLEVLPGTDLYFQYGLTECSRAFVLDARAHADKLHSVGTPFPGIEVRVLTADGGEAAAYQQGEVLLRGPHRAQRFWNRPELEDKHFQDDWVKTGDVGSLDENGFLTLHGRQDDRINCGGLSFFPQEVERELGEMPGVQELLIAAVPDPQNFLHEVPWAFVVIEGEAFREADFLKLARSRVSPAMTPRRVIVLSSLPQTRSGKPDRRSMVLEHGPRR